MLMRRPRRCSAHRQPGGCGVLVVGVVDGDDPAGRARPGSTRRSRRGSRRRSAPRPHRPGPRRGAPSSSCSGMCTAPSMCDSSHSRVRRTSRTTTRAVVADLGQVGEGGPLEPAQRPVGPLLRAAGGRGRGPVDADADQLALRLGDLLGGLAEQGQRGAPRDQPAEVGGELPVEAEVQGARRRARRRTRCGCAGRPPTPPPRSARRSSAGVGQRRRRSGPARAGPAALAGPMCA